jgi:hypothetical protein
MAKIFGYIAFEQDGVARPRVDTLALSCIETVLID